MIRRAFVGGLVALAAGIALALALWPPFHSSLRTRLVSALEEHFKSDVSLASLDISFFPRITAAGSKLIIAHPDPSAPSPLITIESFQAEAGLLDIVRRSLHFRRVDVKGLQVHIPPKRVRKESKVPVRKVTRSDLIIDELFTEESDLIIDTEKPGHVPLLFHIHRLNLRGFAFDKPTAYEATLINPVPPAEVDAKGHFGPWDPDEPRATPIFGDYVMAKADLGVFEGLAGRLSSQGRFDGPLERIAVKGTTTTPDFLLTDTGQPVKLDTVFDAVVDGTNGDVILNEVKASLLRTTIVTKGRVIKVLEPRQGRLIEVTANIDQGRLEDIMRLAVKKKEPPMMGVLSLRTSMRLPPGKGQVVDRLQLQGQFSVASGQFASDTIQQKLGDLSRRGRGEPGEPISARVFSNLKGSFSLRDGVLKFPAITFGVDGATIDLSGTYLVRKEALDFAGTLRLQAKLSETVTGFKSFLLKIVDPLFKGKNAGTELPIVVQGTVDDPKFGVNVRRALTKR